MPKLPSPASFVLFLLGAGFAAFGIATTVGAGTLRSGGTRRTPVVEAVQRAAPAVVSITADLGGWGRGGGARGTGSGVVVHPGGYVVTNSHVIRGATRIVCETPKGASGGRKSYEARVLEDDPAHDLALLRIGSNTPFAYVSLCPTSDVMVGEAAIAIGNPYGLGESVSLGIVSATGRTAALSSGATLTHLLQTDASINLGNSGGALLNLDGELLGINSSVHPNAQGIAFTVPADDVQELLDRNLGPAARPPPPPILTEAVPAPTPVPVLADPPARPAAPTPSATLAPPRAAAPSSTLPAPKARVATAHPPVGLTLRSGTSGVVVSGVVPLSNADIAGLEAGDVIVDVDGVPARDGLALRTSIDAAAPGRTFALTVLRAGKRLPVILPISN